MDDTGPGSNGSKENNRFTVIRQPKDRTDQDNDQVWQWKKLNSCIDASKFLPLVPAFGAH